MARDLTSQMQSGIDQLLVRPCLLVEANFASGPLRVWSGMGTISFGGNDFTGVGWLGSVSALPETAQLQAQGVQLSLSAIPQELLGRVLSEIKHGKKCKIWLGLLDDDGALVADPYQSFAGRIDVGHIGDAPGGQATASITVESRLVDFNRSMERRYTTQDQSAFFPGDLGFDYAPKLAFFAKVWGAPTSSAGLPNA